MWEGVKSSEIATYFASDAKVQTATQRAPKPANISKINSSGCPLDTWSDRAEQSRRPCEILLVVCRLDGCGCVAWNRKTCDMRECRTRLFLDPVLDSRSPCSRHASKQANMSMQARYRVDSSRWTSSSANAQKCSVEASVFCYGGESGLIARQPWTTISS